MLDAIYRVYGRPAQWMPAGSGQTITPVVRRDTRDVQEGFGAGEVLLRTNLIFVRIDEFAYPDVPSNGDRVEIERAAGGVETFRIISDPRLTPDGLEWLCEAKSLDA